MTVQLCFTFYVVGDFELPEDDNTLRIAQLQRDMLAELVADHNRIVSIDDVTDPSERCDDGGKWRGVAVLELSNDGLIESVGVGRSNRPSRHRGLRHEWKVGDVAACRRRLAYLETRLAQQKDDSPADSSESSSTPSPSKGEK